jgi:hypothetical protein
VEEVVAEGVLASELPQWHVCHVIVAHDEATVVPASVIPGDELVHAAAVDLVLLLIEEVDDVVGDLVGWDVARQIEGPDGEVRRDARVGSPLEERLRQGRVGRAVLAHLANGIAGVGDSVRPWKEPELAVKAPVLHVDHDHMPDLLDPPWNSHVTPCTAPDKGEENQHGHDDAPGEGR